MSHGDWVNTPDDPRLRADLRVRELTQPWNLTPPLAFAGGFNDLVYKEEVGGLGDAFEAVEAIALGLSEPVVVVDPKQAAYVPPAFGATEAEKREAGKQLRRAEKLK